MKAVHAVRAARRAVNLSLDGALVEQARAARLDLSAIAEEAIGRALAEATAARFHDEIARGVAEHDEYLAAHGSLADAVRAMGQPNGS